MTPLFRTVLIIVSLGTCILINRKIRKARIRIEESVFWILLSLMFVIFAVWPGVADLMARLLGIYSTANFLFLFIIFILLLKLFQMSFRIGALEEKLKTLVQELALKEQSERLKNHSDKEAESPRERFGLSEIRATNPRTDKGGVGFPREQYGLSEIRATNPRSDKGGTLEDDGHV